MNKQLTQTKEQNEKDCLEYCLNLSNDPKFKEDITNSTHAERVQFLLDNGWEFEDDL